jgi:hypothetical protein
MRPGTIVKDSVSGEVGVVVVDPWNEYTDSQVAIVTDTSNDMPVKAEEGRLEQTGPYQREVSQVEDCGLKAGRLCCRYLGKRSDGVFSCNRFTTLRNLLIFGDQEAQGQPLRLLPPDCQKDVQSAISRMAELATKQKTQLTLQATPEQV